MGKGIVKARYIILAVFVALIVVSVIFLPKMISKVNYDLTSYLPEGYETRDGYEFLSETFNIHGDVEIGVETSREKMSKAAERIFALDGVTNTVWAEYLEMLVQFGVYSPDSEEFGALYDVLTDAPVPTIDSEGNFVYDQGTYNWALLITLKYPPSSQEAIKIYGQIVDILNEEVGENNFAASGMTEQANALYETVFDEIWLYCLIAGIVVLIILLVTTNSLIEPIVLLLTMVISIIINMGTNVIFPSTSIITFACGAILQLGLSMDYAIFLLHQYRAELRSNLDPKQALAAAIPKSAKAVASSALTTVCGFLALLCMQFEIGTDLGLTLAKGILCSLLTVIFLQPCLMLLMNKAHMKTQHKCLDFHFRAPVKRCIRDRKWAVGVVALLFIPALVASNFLHYNYVKFMPDKDDTSVKYSMAKELGNQVMVVVPNELIDENGNPILDENGYHQYLIEENYDFVEKLQQLGAEKVTVEYKGENITVDKISFMLGMYVMFPEDGTLKIPVSDTKTLTLTLPQMLKLVDVFNMFQGGESPNYAEIVQKINDIIAPQELNIVELISLAGSGMTDQMSMLQSYMSGGYTMYTVGITYPEIDNESQTSFDILDEIKAIANYTFGDTGMRCYLTGYTQGAYDFAAVTPNDYTLVTIISIVAILAILIVTLGGIKFPVLLVALIEFGIWVNLAMQFIFAGGGVNFMSYLVISAVQLGATVDYAILITTKYCNLRKRFEPRQASYMATTSSVMSVMTSALIMAGACFSVYFVTSNLIIKEMTFLMARGSIISAILVIFVLPALLVVADKIRGNELHIMRTPFLRPYNRKRVQKYVPVLVDANGETIAETNPVKMTKDERRAARARAKEEKVAANAAKKAARLARKEAKNARKGNRTDT
ncbi:MAG: efflux RND transporter permease subunit [Acutalibacteraceae bacterium]